MKTPPTVQRWTKPTIWEKKVPWTKVKVHFFRWWWRHWNSRPATIRNKIIGYNSRIKKPKRTFYVSFLDEETCWTSNNWLQQSRRIFILFCAVQPHTSKIVFESYSYGRLWIDSYGLQLFLKCLTSFWSTEGV